MVHGGSDNIVENNVIVDAGMYLIEGVPIRQRPMVGNIVRRNILVGDGDKVMMYRCTRWMEGEMAFERNLVWGRGGPARVNLGAAKLVFEGWEQWLKAGLDRESMVGELRFVDEANDDYRLRDDSPAWELGFQRIPVEQIGCYASEERATWPLRCEQEVVREEFVLYSMPVLPLREDFEYEKPGWRPRHGDVLAYKRAPVMVVRQKAASGRQSLKMVDAKGLPRTWEPRIFWPLDFSAGTVRFSCSFWLDPEKPPKVLVDFRQYSDTGGREYFSGPLFVIEQDGRITSRGKEIARAPMGQWFKVELIIHLGTDAARSSKGRIVSEDESAPIEIPHVSEQFRKLERIVISCLTDAEAVVYIDDVVCEAVR